MKKLNFNNLSNIEVPESLIKSALNVPDENPKRNFLSIRFYRNAAGIAACVALAALIFSLMSGINKNVNLIEPGTIQNSDVITAETEPDTTVDFSAAEESTSLPNEEEYQNSKAVTEPYEYNGYTGDKSNNQSSDTQAPEGSKPNNEKEFHNYASSGYPQPLTSEPAEQAPYTQKPTEENPPQTEPEVEPTTENQDDEPIGSVMELWFKTRVDGRFIQGDAYCRIEDENGNVLGSEDLYDSCRRVYENPAYNNRVELFLIDTSNLRLIPGKTYSVIFYDSRGRILKQGLVFIDPNETTVYEI